MNFELLQEYVVPVIMLTCYLVGYVIKRWVDDVDNKYIPTVVFVLGIFLNVWLNNWDITPTIMLVGMASGLASTGANEMIEHLLKKDECFKG